MRSKSFFLSRDAVLCTAAALLSVAIGLTISRHLRVAHLSQTTTSTLAPASLGPTLSLMEFRDAVDSGKSLIIDARDDFLYARGHVPHALSLPNRRFETRYSQLRPRLADPTQAIILYCSNVYCGDSTEAQTRLKQLGYINVSVFPEGWDAWKTAGYPEEKSDAAIATLPPWKNPS